MEVTHQAFHNMVSPTLKIHQNDTLKDLDMLIGSWGENGVVSSTKELLRCGEKRI